MAGHSKWANIKHKKAATDAKRGKIWTRLIREITVATKLAGPDVTANPRLRLAIEKAMAANMPKDNVARAIAKGSGKEDNVNYEDVRYEGYGIAGAAIIVECMTDNRTRTVAEVRHAFNKYGGNMGTEGSVAFLFKHQGQLFFKDIDEENLFNQALELGALDVNILDDGGVEVITSAYDFVEIKEQLAHKGFVAEFSEVGMKAENEVELSEEDTAKMQKLVDALENLDDVQDVYTSALI
jgi:YebC/PmpR family DNA-binding regulatory protein